MNIWVFTSNNCRFEPNWTEAEAIENPSAFIDPDRTLVAGVEPHHYKPPVDGRKRGGVFLPMDKMERRTRKVHHDRYGVDNDTRRKPQRAKPTLRWKKAAAIGAALAALAAAAAYHFSPIQISPITTGGSK